MREALLALLLCAVGSLAVAGGAPGSWTGAVPPLRLALADRVYSSAPLQPASHHDGGRAEVTSVRWRYAVSDPALAAVELCRGSHCIPLPMASGRSAAFTGMGLDQPFHFRARLAPHARRPVQLGELELIVNYR